VSQPANPTPVTVFPRAVVLQSLGASAFLAAIWIVFALVNPTTTYHLSPVLVAAAPGFVLRWATPGSVSWRHAAMATVSGAAIAAGATLVLVLTNALQGPVLAVDFGLVAGEGNALDETLIAIGIGMVLGVLGATARFPSAKRENRAEAEEQRSSTVEGER